MNEGSFSFLSLQSQRYQFQQGQGNDSKFSFKDPFASNLPGNKSSLTGKTDIVLLLQAAEIERLTESLNIYRNKVKQLSNDEKNLSISHQEGNSAKSETLLNGKKSIELLNSQSLLSLSSSQGSIEDVKKFIEKTQNKYKRALKFIEETTKARQEAEIAYEEVKLQLIETENTFDAFKATSIKQYQLLREELEQIKKAELSFQMKQARAERQNLKNMMQREQFNFTSERKNFQLQLKIEKDKLEGASNEIKRLKDENKEYRLAIEKVEVKQREILIEKENTLALVSLENERLSSVIKEKIKIIQENSQQFELTQNKLISEINSLKRQNDLNSHNFMSSEDQIRRLNSEITQLTSQISNLTSQLNHSSLVSEENKSEYRIKESRLNNEIRNLSEVISTSQFRFNQQSQEYKSKINRLTRELSQARQEFEFKEQGYRKKEFQRTNKIMEIEQEISNLKRQLFSMTEKQGRLREELRTTMKKGMIESQTLEKKLEEVNNESKLFQDRKKIEYERVISDLKRNYEKRIKDLEERLIDSQERIQEYQYRLQQENMEKSSLFSENTSLRAQIEFKKRQKQNGKQRSVDQLFQEIEKLCINVKQKENYIEELQFQISSLNESSKKSLNETLYLRQLLSKTVHLIELFEQNRKEDQRSLVGEFQKLFQGQTNILSELKYTSRSANSKSIVETYESQLLRTKESEIRHLKERMSYLQSQSNQKSNVEEIIKKSVSVTQQNLDLKNIITKKDSQLDNYKNINTKLRFDIEKAHQVNKQIMNEKQSLSKRLQSQLDSVNNVLFEEKQNFIKTQSVNLSLESYRKYSEKELANRDELVNELKNQLKLKNEQNSRIALIMEEEVNLNRKLNEQINELKKSFNYQLYKKIEEIENLTQECQKQKRNLSDLQSDKRNLENEVERTKTQNSLFLQEKSRHQTAIAGYNEKMPILNAEFERLQKIIEELKTKNNYLIMTNHQYEIQLQRVHLDEQKMSVLNDEIMRLEAENLNITEDLNRCRLEIGQDSQQQRQLVENQALFVLLFVEIESLRMRVSAKEKQIEEIRRFRLKN